MSKEKTPYHPTPGDYDVEKLTGIKSESSYGDKSYKNNESHSKIYSRPTKSMDNSKNDLNASKPKPVTGSIAMNNNDHVFEYKDGIQNT